MVESRGSRVYAEAMTGRTFILLLGGGVFLALALLIGGPLLALRPSFLNPATPPILKGVRAGGGWNSMGCSRSSSMRFDPGKEALSPDLTPRLAVAFPAGSDADAVRTVLIAQGFHSIEPCRDDPSVQRVAFSQTGGGLAGPFPISAVVAWKRTDTGQVEWTKGFVAYIAP